jgi:hypothetical protein
MSNLNQAVEYYDEDEEFISPNKKRETKRRWREIERLKERRRLSKELAGNDAEYFDFLEPF